LLALLAAADALEPARAALLAAEEAFATALAALLAAVFAELAALFAYVAALLEEPTAACKSAVIVTRPVVGSSIRSIRSFNILYK
jgi:hypothetical protein